MRPPPQLLDRLMTTRLMPLRAQPAAGVGERRSRLKGAGMEFLDHRPYRAGDDTRHLDLHVLARTGEAVIREYAQMRQLPITVVLDGSGSMAADARKFEQASLLAQVLGYVGLAAGDRVQVVVAGADGLRWSPRLQGGQRADTLFRWIADQPAGGTMGFADALHQIAGQLNVRGMVVAISDWWDEDLPEQLALLDAAGQEVLALQVLSPVERQPELLGKGILTLADAETGDEIEVRMTPDTFNRYTKMLAEWQQRLTDICSARQWHFLSLDSDADLTEFCMRTLRGRGVLS